MHAILLLLLLFGSILRTNQYFSGTEGIDEILNSLGGNLTPHIFQGQKKKKP